MYRQWAESTPQGFGTKITLAATYDDIMKLNKTVGNVLSENDFISDNIIDPTYPYIVDEEVVSLIDERVHTGDPKQLPSGDYLCVRSEITCAYLFGEEEDIKPLVEHLSLHP
jgi:hypothetical protein